MLILALLILTAALRFPSLASANPVPYPSEPNKEPPTLQVQSPQNGTVYTADTAELAFTVTKPDAWNYYWLSDEGIPVIGSYSVSVYLDGKLNGTYNDPHLRDAPATNYSMVLEGLTRGEHRVKIDLEAWTFYENPNPGPCELDYYTYQLGNVSETLHFTINADPSPSPSATPEQPQGDVPTTLVATASAALVALVGVGLILYFKKRRH